MARAAYATAIRIDSQIRVHSRRGAGHPSGNPYAEAHLDDLLDGWLHRAVCLKSTDSGGCAGLGAGAEADPELTLEPPPEPSNDPTAMGPCVMCCPICVAPLPLVGFSHGMAGVRFQSVT